MHVWLDKWQPSWILTLLSSCTREPVRLSWRGSSLWRRSPRCSVSSEGKSSQLQTPPGLWRSDKTSLMKDWRFREGGGEELNLGDLAALSLTSCVLSNTVWTSCLIVIQSRGKVMTLVFDLWKMLTWAWKKGELGVGTIFQSSLD